mmetsp:Transcript_2008/g.4606  ORF Transcript_2008/g.4606 Transcript_2008/m.4606 type:complete len:183 (+) Transcript_2008:332-880(+)
MRLSSLATCGADHKLERERAAENVQGALRVERLERVLGQQNSVCVRFKPRNSAEMGFIVHSLIDLLDPSRLLQGLNAFAPSELGSLPDALGSLSCALLDGCLAQLPRSCSATSAVTVFLQTALGSGKLEIHDGPGLASLADAPALRCGPPDARRLRCQAVEPGQARQGIRLAPLQSCAGSSP